VALTKVSPSLFATSNNITSVTVGGSANTISLTFDASGVITSASNNAVSVANTAITGNIISSQITSVANTQITGNIISSQISPSVTLTTPIISGNLNLDSAGTTGIRVPSANTIAFYGAGIEDVRIDSSGQMIIGSTSVGRGDKLTVVGAGTLSTVTSSVRGLLAVESDTATAQNVGGAISLGGNYDAGRTQYGAIGGFKESTTSSEYGGYLAFFTRPNGDVTKERARIDSGGTLLVGTTTSSVSTTPGVVIIGSSGAQGYWLNNNTTSGGSSLALFYSSYSTANQTKFEVDSSGNVKSRTNSYAGFSDERLKQNITPASSQWNDIKSYDVVKFQMKSEQFSDEENPWMLGVVAQQVEKISPKLVDEDIRDGMKTVKYSILYMKSVKALQEAMARIETLESKTDTQAETINALTSTITALTARVVALES
jgi:hypothetical protein